MAPTHTTEDLSGESAETPANKDFRLRKSSRLRPRGCLDGDEEGSLAVQPATRRLPRLPALRLRASLAKAAAASSAVPPPPAPSFSELQIRQRQGTTTNIWGASLTGHLARTARKGARTQLEPTLLP